MKTIDKKQVYSLGRYTYKNFVTLSEDETRLVWNWRNDERICRWMTNKEQIPYENHLRFIEGLKEREDKYYWLVYKDDKPIAVFDIVDVDYQHGETEPGYYLCPDLLNSGEGLFFNYNFRRILFDVFGFQSVKGNIKIGNDRALMMSTFFQVKPFGIAMFEDGEHLLMKGNREEFSTVQEKGLLKNFVRYAKTCVTDWDDLIKQFRK